MLLNKKDTKINKKYILFFKHILKSDTKINKKYILFFKNDILLKKEDHYFKNKNFYNHKSLSRKCYAFASLQAEGNWIIGILFGPLARQKTIVEGVSNFFHI